MPTFLHTFMTHTVVEHKGLNLMHWQLLGGKGMVFVNTE